VRHVDDRLRSTADWLADGVDTGGALDRVRRKKFRRRVVRRAQTTGRTVAVVLIAAGTIVLLARVFGLDQRPQPAAPSGGNAIAVVRGTDEQRDIFLISPSGEEVRRLTDGPGVNELPSWSPDGERLAFIRGDPAGEPYGVYVIGADGRGLAKISGEVLAEESRPGWSPDGARIVFSGYAASELPVRDNFVQTDLYVVDVEGGKTTRVTGGETVDFDPVWSPDGSRIIFVRAKGLRVEEDPTPEHIPQIYAMAPDGSKVVRLTDLSRGASNPAWAPDGSRIAFESDGDIFVMNPDGGDVSRLAVETGAGENPNPHPTYGNYEPSWSPDGSRIVFVSDRDGDRDLYVMPATGTEDQAVRLIDSPEEEFHPAWQPAPPHSDASPAPDSPSPECPELEEGSMDLPESYQPLGTWSEADVFGDGRPHRARLFGDQDRPPRCRYFLVVEHVGGAVFIAPITLFDWLMDVPSPLMSAEIDGEPGLELVVDFGGPMHPHRTGQVFTFKDGSLVQMRLEPSRGVPPMLFPLHGEFPGSVDCAGDPGTIVVTLGSLAEGGADDRHFDITRSFYRAEGTLFIETRQRSYTVEVGTEQERWPELADDPFRSCPSR
jgi:TolB protein